MAKSNLTIETADDSIVYIKGKYYIKDNTKEAEKWKNPIQSDGIELYVYEDGKVEIKE